MCNKWGVPCKCSKKNGKIHTDTHKGQKVSLMAKHIIFQLKIGLLFHTISLWNERVPHLALYTTLHSTHLPNVGANHISNFNLIVSGMWLKCLKLIYRSGIFDQSKLRFRDGNDCVVECVMDYSELSFRGASIYIV